MNLNNSSIVFNSAIEQWNLWLTGDNIIVRNGTVKTVTTVATGHGQKNAPISLGNYNDGTGVTNTTASTAGISRPSSPTEVMQITLTNK